MAKKLRLIAAELTDVGRRRERNQDNVAHHIPEDDGTLADKGALFVVCDGMGGHAAGEVAAELGVNAIRDVYYSGQTTDTITGLANAIKHANESIFAYAREHSELAGMGTTCVGLVVHSGRAYFVNIGDSRAYVVRNGVMRQVTQDHSWVSEQVRAGILTEEQARTHAHRNVITRSLGTQPTVTADLFIETLKDGDRVLLCSDGLHGYVDEREIEREMIGHEHPAEGARHLINMANDNGGPDNITALVVHLLEVPDVTGEVMIPEAVTGEEQVITQPIPAISAGAGSAAARIAEKRLAHAKPARKARRRAPAALGALRVLAVAALVLLSLGIWDVAFGPYAAARNAAAQLQTDIARAQQAVQQEPAQDPAAALAALADARQRVVADLQNPALDSQSQANAQNMLDTQLTPAVQNAEQAYNAKARITPVSISDAAMYSVDCSTPNATGASSLTSVTALTAVAGAANAPAQALYVLNAGTLYQMTAPLDGTGAPASGSTTCASVSVGTGTSVLALAANEGTLYALARGGSGAYQVLTITQAKVTSTFAVPTPHGEVPATLAAFGGTVYVGYQAGTAGMPGIWEFTGTAPKGPAKNISLTQPVTSLAAANGTLYMVLADGSLGQLDTSSALLPLPVTVLPPVTADNASSYTAATPVPTPLVNHAAGSANGTLFPGGAVLVADPLVKTHVLLGDGASNRVVRFVVGTAEPGLGLDSQFVYGAPFAGATQLALAANAGTLDVYIWSGTQLAGFVVPDPAG